MGNVETQGTRLIDADDSVTITLADGAEVEIYGDGLLFFWLDPDVQDESTCTVNLYATTD